MVKYIHIMTSAQAQAYVLNLEQFQPHHATLLNSEGEQICHSQSLIWLKWQQLPDLSHHIG